MKNETKLKKLAHEMFDPELANEVIALMDESNSKLVAPTPLGPDQMIEVSGFDLIWLVDEIFYDDVACGQYTAYCNMKVLPGENQFKFVQYDKEPYFSFKTSNGHVITPTTMDFDGGSIPYFFRMFKTFSPTFYIPAYLIHDWLFVRHRENSPPDHDFTFKETAVILAEAIKTLMEIGYYDENGRLVQLEKNEDTLFLIYLAVRTPIAKALWNKSK
ncbi:hypothetical protein [Acinetobacter pittii]|uniref:hypothetical protein n=1 Tax=Acinetobacter TaxID=469 RepID=UPI003261845D